MPSPNPMNIVPPVAGSTPGPLWAQGSVNSINEILTNQVAPHDHTGDPNGVKLTQASLNITGLLNLNGNILANTKQVDLDTQTSVVSSNAIYANASGDLYYNNSAGTPVQITTGGSLMPTNTIGQGIVNLISPAQASYNAGTFRFRSSTLTNTYAEVWSGPVKVYSGITANPAGGIALVVPNTPALTSDKTFTLSPNNLTLPQSNAPSNKVSSVIINSSGVMSLAAQPTRTTIATTSWSTTGTILATITLAANTASGRPLLIQIVPTENVASAYILMKNNAAGTQNTPINGSLYFRITSSVRPSPSTYFVGGNAYRVYDPIINTDTNGGVRVPPANVAIYEPTLTEVTTAITIDVIGLAGSANYTYSVNNASVVVSEV